MPGKKFNSGKKLKMTLSWDKIYYLEINEKYPEAINAIEDKLKETPGNAETVIRLGFNLWFAIVEDDRMKLNLPIEQYANRFMELLNEYRSKLQDNADFCFSYGLGLSSDYYRFVKNANDIKELKKCEKLGKDILKRASKIDSFYKKVIKGKVSKDELSEHFKGRGCFERYFNIS